MLTYRRRRRRRSALGQAMTGMGGMRPLVSRQLVSDSFDRGDSATVGSPDNDYGGGSLAATWGEQSGTWDIAGNKCVLSGTSTLAHNVFDHGTADVWLQTKVQTSNAGSAQGFVVRQDDSSNEWRAVLATAAGNSLILAQVVAGSPTLRINKPVSLSANVDYLLTCRAKGTVWYLEIRLASTGALLQSGSFSDTGSDFNQTKTVHGLFGNTSTIQTTSFDWYRAKRT